MALTSPQDAVYPKSRFKSIRVLYDGTQPPCNEFSIAEIELHSGEKRIGIRLDKNVWNEDNHENGYPVVRGGRPSWFLLPHNAQGSIGTFLQELNNVYKNNMP